MIRNWNCILILVALKKKKKVSNTYLFIKFGGKNKSPLEMIRENEILINR